MPERAWFPHELKVSRCVQARAKQCCPTKVIMIY
jgi:hypothetical protein